MSEEEEKMLDALLAESRRLKRRIEKAETRRREIKKELAPLRKKEWIDYLMERLFLLPAEREEIDALSLDDKYLKLDLLSKQEHGPWEIIV